MREAIKNSFDQWIFFYRVFLCGVITDEDVRGRPDTVSPEQYLHKSAMTMYYLYMGYRIFQKGHSGFGETL